VSSTRKRRAEWQPVLLLVLAWPSAGVHAQPQSVTIPLQYVYTSVGYKLGISVGINGGAPQPYVFDTGSSVFNAAFNPATWNGFGPTVPNATVPKGTGVNYCYGSGTCFTGNLVQGALLAETATAAPGRAYWIADAESYALRDILATVRDALAAEGLTVTKRAPLRIPRVAGVVAERLDRAAQTAGQYVQALHVLGELKDTIACDIGRARKDLGYEPTVALYEGMRESVRWCLAQGWSL
jgi:hypothetical protein